MNSQIAPAPYIIHGSLPDRYPRGWFCIGAGYEFSTEPKMLNYFGTSLVAYRGEDTGKLHVLDAFCPHMGANLADGCVKGESVICPFHEWSWGADGVCNDIPYAKKIPVKARITSWYTHEANQLVYLWNDPDGNPPIKEQAIPDEAIVAEEGWTPWVIRRVHVENNCRELIDNMADKAHFSPVHGLPEITHFSNVSEGHKYTQFMNGHSENGLMKSEATYHGPGYMIHKSTTVAEGEPDRRFMSLVMNVPTSMESFEFLAGFKERVPEGMEGDIDAQTAYVNELIDDGVESSVFADLAIWKNKCTIDNPILCDGDGPVTKLRQWYAQFLVPVDQVPESLQEKRIYDKTS